MSAFKTKVVDPETKKVEYRYYPKGDDRYVVLLQGIWLILDDNIPEKEDDGKGVQV